MSLATSPSKIPAIGQHVDQDDSAKGRKYNNFIQHICMSQRGEITNILQLVHQVAKYQAQ